jgi:hypothetical protein
MPRTDFYIKQGDTQPAIEARLLTDGEPVDLTGAAVLFTMQHGSKDKQVNGLCTIQGARSEGTVAYIWDETDTEVEGIYEAEFRIDYDLPESVSEFEKDETFPPDRMIQIEVTDTIERTV